MKASPTKDSSHSNSHSSKPFFSKNGEGGFFSKESEEPFFSPATIQPRLNIGSPNDEYEQEADQMADSISCMSEDDGIQTKCDTCQGEENNGATIQTEPVIQRKEEEEEFESLQTMPLAQKLESDKNEENLQTKPLMLKTENGGGVATSSLTSQLTSTKGGGSSLPKETNSFMSQAFGRDFSDVRVHTDSSAIQMNQGLGAKAFTHGSDIYFNQGQYKPESSEGKRLLGHELTHVVQQTPRIENFPTLVREISKTKAPSVQRSIEPYPNVSGDFIITVPPNFRITDDIPEEVRRFIDLVRTDLSRRRRGRRNMETLMEAQGFMGQLPTVWRRLRLMRPGVRQIRVRMVGWRERDVTAFLLIERGRQVQAGLEGAEQQGPSPERETPEPTGERVEQGEPSPERETTAQEPLSVDEIIELRERRGETAATTYLTNEYIVLNQRLQRAINEAIINIYPWRMLYREAGSAFATEMDAHTTALTRSTIEFQREAAIWGAVFSIVGQGLVSALSTFVQEGSRLAGRNPALADLVRANTLEDVVQVSIDRSANQITDLGGTAYSRGGGIPVPTGRIPQVYQNQLLNRVEFQAFQCLGSLVNHQEIIQDIQADVNRRLSRLHGRDLRDAIELEGRRLIELQSFSRRTIEMASNSFINERPPRCNMVEFQRELGRGIWASWLPRIVYRAPRLVGGQAAGPARRTHRIARAVTNELDRLGITEEALDGRTYGLIIGPWDRDRLVLWARRYRPNIIIPRFE